MPRKAYHNQARHYSEYVHEEMESRGHDCPRYGKHGWGWHNPCEHHGCPGCGHHMHHGAEVGCSAPDPRTGWCECEHGRLENRKNLWTPLLHNGGKP